MPARRSRSPDSDVDMDISDDNTPQAGPSSAPARRAQTLRRIPESEDDDDDAEEASEEEANELEGSEGEDELDEAQGETSSEVDVVDDVDDEEEEEEEEPAPPPPKPTTRSPRTVVPPRKPAAASPRKAAPLRGGGSGLKIKLKMPATNASTSASASPSLQPEEADDDEEEDVEGEGDEMSVESEDDDEEEMMPSKTGRLTARQAALANAAEKDRNDYMPDPEPTSIANSSRRKKKELNELELALKREETARKRKNLSEKRLEDEKTETINRLLRKQSRPRNRRNALASAEDAASVVGSEAPGGEGGEDDVAMEEREETPPTMWRWVSSARLADGEPPDARKMVVSLGVPVAVLPAAALVEEASSLREERPAALVCAVQGCGEARKYRLVKDWTRGACGVGHLKQLEASA